jgi:peptidoglycan/xylan/chitin deacetylase (PgdA/CDA1 family)
LKAGFLKDILTRVVRPAFEAFWQQPGGTVVLCYHGLIPESLSIGDFCFMRIRDFEDQMRYLSQNCDVVPLDSYLTPNLDGRRRVAITFDDGYQSNFDLAFPILKRYGFSATIFLNTAFTDTDDYPWFCRLLVAMALSKRKEIDWRGEILQLRDDREKRSASERIQTDLKLLRNHNELLDQLRRTIELLEVDLTLAGTIDDPFRMLCGESIREMSESGLVRFGAHTHTHAILTHIEAEVADDEIQRSVQLVSSLTDALCTQFAYPNGSRLDFDDKSIDALRRNGIQLAVTTIPGVNISNTSKYALRRYCLGESESIVQFGAIISGQSDFLATAKAKLRR